MVFPGMAPLATHRSLQLARDGWECSTATYCECGQTWWSPTTVIKQRSTAMAENKHDDQKERAEWWHALIQRYSELNLTFGKDKLPAFSGVARWIRGEFPTR